MTYPAQLRQIIPKGWKLSFAVVMFGQSIRCQPNWMTELLTFLKLEIITRKCVVIPFSPNLKVRESKDVFFPTLAYWFPCKTEITLRDHSYQHRVHSYHDNWQCWLLEGGERENVRESDYWGHVILVSGRIMREKSRRDNIANSYLPNSYLPNRYLLGMPEKSVSRKVCSSISPASSLDEREKKGNYVQVSCTGIC